MNTLFGNFGSDYGLLTVLMIILVLVLLFRSMVMTMRLNRLERKYKAFMKGAEATSLETQFIRKFDQIDRLYESKADHDSKLQILKDRADNIYSKYGIEKYDAFDDVGGKLSFALALLNRDNTGIILNAVHSQDNCFLYLKEIVKGESYVMLSQEEVEALRKAVNIGGDYIVHKGEE